MIIYDDVMFVDVQKICQNLNYRHRMAQLAGRASVALHTEVCLITGSSCPGGGGYPWSSLQDDIM